MDIIREGYKGGYGKWSTILEGEIKSCLVCFVVVEEGYEGVNNKQWCQIPILPLVGYVVCLLFF